MNYNSNNSNNLNNRQYDNPQSSNFNNMPNNSYPHGGGGGGGIGPLDAIALPQIYSMGGADMLRADPKTQSNGPGANGPPQQGNIPALRERDGRNNNSNSNTNNNR
jgi:hypothetical protein